jgi:hypothetical protein
MTPAREKLLRLALAMPEEGVPTICRMIAWICPGIDDPAKPAMIRDAAGLLDDLMRIEDKALRDRWVAEIDRLRNEPPPAIVQRDNVVSLFREIAGRLTDNAPRPRWRELAGLFSNPAPWTVSRQSATPAVGSKRDGPAARAILGEVKTKAPRARAPAAGSATRERRDMGLCPGTAWPLARTG